MLNFLSQAARKSVSSVTSVVGGTRFARAGGHSDPPLQRGTRIGDPTARRGAIGYGVFMDTFVAIHAHSCGIADRKECGVADHERQ